VQYKSLSNATIDAAALVIVLCGAALVIASAVAPPRRGIADWLAGTYPVMV
jgi:hypothetical protein